MNLTISDCYIILEETLQLCKDFPEAFVQADRYIRQQLANDNYNLFNTIPMVSIVGNGIFENLDVEAMPVELKSFWDHLCTMREARPALTQDPAIIPTNLKILTYFPDDTYLPFFHSILKVTDILTKDFPHVAMVAQQYMRAALVNRNMLMQANRTYSLANLIHEAMKPDTFLNFYTPENRVPDDEINGVTWRLHRMFLDDPEQDALRPLLSKPNLVDNEEW